MNDFVVNNVDPSGTTRRILTNRRMQKYSFDIFDTVLFRILADPEDIFVIMGKYLSENGAEELQRIAPVFHHIRVFSEFKARRIVPSNDVTFDDIYHVMQSDFKLSSESVRYIKKTEFETEERYLVPNDGLRHSIKMAREFSGGVIYISDMYLPTHFLKSILKKYGLYEAQDRIYVSGDIGLTKSSGRLFHHVLNCENIEPGDLQHLGDNRYSDYDIPRSLGIRAGLFGTVPPLRHTRRIDILMEKVLYVSHILWAGIMTLRFKWFGRV